jgi:hypothetical protein
MVAALLCAVLAPFSYESAVTAGGFLLLVEWLLWRRGTLPGPALWSLALPGLGLPFLVIWQMVPSSYDPVAFPGWEALWQSSIYFVQGLTWPVTLGAKRLMVAAGWSDGHATALVGYLALGALLALYLRTRRTTHLLFCLGWFALSLVVQWVSLSFRYVIDGPRMLYGASVGMVLLWADLIHQAGDRADRLGQVGRGLALVSLLAMVGWGAWFGMVRMSLVADGASVLNQASERAEASSPDQVGLFINIPAWITVADTDFALGHEGYTLLPPYYSVGLSDYVRVNRGLDRDMRIVGLADVRQEWRGRIGYHGDKVSPEALAHQLRAVDYVMILTYPGSGLSLADVGGVAQATPAVAAREPIARYGEAIALSGVEIVQASGERPSVALAWTSLEPLSEPYTIFVHAYGSDGGLVAQADGYALGGTYPPEFWQPGELIRDIRHLPAVSLLESRGGLQLGIGLYSPETGKRLPAYDPAGNRLPDDVYRRLLTAG